MFPQDNGKYFWSQATAAQAQANTAVNSYRLNIKQFCLVIRFSNVQYNIQHFLPVMHVTKRDMLHMLTHENTTNPKNC